MSVDPRARRIAVVADSLFAQLLPELHDAGYGIIQLLRLRSGGAFDLAEGTVYPVLRKLENEGLVKSGWAEVQGRRRRVYQLTAAGRRELAERKEAWRRFSTAMVVVLGGS